MAPLLPGPVNISRLVKLSLGILADHLEEQVAQPSDIDRWRDFVRLQSRMPVIQGGSL
jgi:hypothetical protein